MIRNILQYTLAAAMALTAIYIGVLTAADTGWLPAYSLISGIGGLPTAGQYETTENTHARPTMRYIEVTESCGPDYAGACVHARTGPDETYPSIVRLRTGTVLAVSDTIEEHNRTWYRVSFNEWLRYPERVSGSMYVAADIVTPFDDVGPEEIQTGTLASSTKYIIIDRSDQTLTAYDNDTLVMREPISTGLDFTPTPRGTFYVYKKTPSRYMQGPIPDISTKYYDLPGVPWNLYFTEQGAVIHGAYWHNHFGEPWSNGCVNLPPQTAKVLYRWAELGTRVVVQD